MTKIIGLTLALISFSHLSHSQEADKGCAIVFDESKEDDAPLETKKPSTLRRLKGVIDNSLIKSTTKHGDQIANNDPNGFGYEMLHELTQQYKHEHEEFSPPELNKRIESRIQNTAASNGNARVTSYFRYYEKNGGDQSTYDTIKAFWSRRRYLPTNEEWEKAMSHADAIIKKYTNLRHDLMRLVAKGFEALELNRQLEEVLSQYSARDFSDNNVRITGIEFTKPIYRYNQNLGIIRKVNSKSRTYRYDSLVLDYKSSGQLYEEIFGITASPVQRFLTQRRIKKPFDWSKIKRPMYILMTPFHIIGLTYKVIKSGLSYSKQTLIWSSTFIRHKDGAFQKRVVAQAFEKRRLEMIREALLTRSKELQVPLNKEEGVLIERINSAIKNPRYLPNQKALRIAQRQELDAEKTMVFNKDPDLKDQKSLNSLSVFETHEADPTVGTVQSYYFNKVKRKIKQWAPTFVVGVIVVGTATTQYNQIKNRLLDYPEVAYRVTELSNILYDFNKKYFGLKFLVYDDVKAADRGFNLEVSAIPNVSKDATQIFQDQFRIDQKQFLTDPEYKAEIREVIEATLIEREKRGGAIAYQYSVNQAKNWAYPTRTIKKLFAAWFQEIPGIEATLTPLRDQLLQLINDGVDLSKNKDIVLEEINKISDQLTLHQYYQLKILLTERLAEAIEYYAANGDLVNPYDTIYNYFIRMNNSIYKINNNWIVRSSPEKVNKSFIFDNIEPAYVNVVSKVGGTDYFEVKFLDPPEVISPTGKYYIHKDGLSKIPIIY